MILPTTLNGYPVILANAHNNGYATVMVHRADNEHQPYVVATWWSELGTAWSWGHYCDNGYEAQIEFAEVERRNRRRLTHMNLT